jgi:hypothetical protein
MIVRILGEGQWEVADDEMDVLNQLDARVEAAVDAASESDLAAALAGLLDRVRTSGRPVPNDQIVVSELVLPYADATLDDVRDLLNDDGLIPG